jgi:hypothetical protein
MQVCWVVGGRLSISRHRNYVNQATHWDLGFNILIYERHTTYALTGVETLPNYNKEYIYPTSKD